MQIKSTMRDNSHLLELLMSKTQEVTSSGKDAEKRKPLTIKENNMKFSQKIKNGTTLQCSNSTFVQLPEENENTIPKRYSYPIFTAPLFTTAKMWKQPKCLSTDEWLSVLLYTMNIIQL